MIKHRRYLAAVCAAILAVPGISSSFAQDPRPTTKPIITFIELGSLNCIPCKAMRPVMTDIETTYGGRVRVDFYDVRTKEGEPFGKKYGIRVIPTQVFLDRDGKEFFRHEGFFLASDIKALFKEHGVVP